MCHGRWWIYYISSGYHLEAMLFDNIWQKDQLVSKGLNTKEHIVSVMHASLMAHSKEHINVLTAVWLISVFSVYTHAQTHTQALIFASGCISQLWSCCCWQHDPTVFTVSLSVYRIRQGITAWHAGLSCRRQTYEQGGSEQHVMVNQWLEKRYL